MLTCFDKTGSDGWATARTKAGRQEELWSPASRRMRRLRSEGLERRAHCGLHESLAIPTREAGTAAAARGFRWHK
jgi:hypothetical protein